VQKSLRGKKDRSSLFWLIICVLAVLVLRFASSVSLRDAALAGLALLEPGAEIMVPQPDSKWQWAVVCCKQQAQKDGVSQLSLPLV